MLKSYMKDFLSDFEIKVLNLFRILVFGFRVYPCDLSGEGVVNPSLAACILPRRCEDC